MGDFGLAFWTVVGLTLLVLAWLCLHPPSAVLGWGAWLGLLCFSLATHAARRHLFGRFSIPMQPAGKSARKSYRKPARSPY